MRAYELMVIVDGETDDAAVERPFAASANRSRPARRDQDHRSVGSAPLRLRDQPQARGLLRRVRDRGRGRRPRRARAPAAPRGRGRPPQADPSARPRGRPPRAARRAPRPLRPDDPRRASMPDNTVTLVGNVTRDPELRFTPSGQAIATFGLAVNRRCQTQRRSGRSRPASSTSSAGARWARTRRSRCRRAPVSW